jgi:hypothetical protein
MPSFCVEGCGRKVACGGNRCRPCSKRTGRPCDPHGKMKAKNDRCNPINNPIYNPMNKAKQRDYYAKRKEDPIYMAKQRDYSAKRREDPIYMAKQRDYYAKRREEKPYACDWEGCDAAFANSSHLARHKKSVHTREGQEKKKKQENRVLTVLEKAGFDVHKQCHIKIEGCVRDVSEDTGRYRSFIDVHILNQTSFILLLEVDECQH